MIRFQPGHALKASAHALYIEREADQQLWQRLSAGEFTFLAAPRQVGKTSLLRRTAARLNGQGVTTMFVDLQGLSVPSGTAPAAAEASWYRSLASIMARQLRIGERVKPFFDAAVGGAVDVWLAFVRDEILTLHGGRVVLFLDEIDRTRSYNFSRDAFFGALRAARNAAAAEGGFERWTVCLCGVTSPQELVSDPTSLPVDIPSDVMRLRDLTRAELDGFAPALGMGADAKAVLDAVFAWTHGHPAMTQKLCGALISPEWRELPMALRVERVVDKLYLGEGRHHDVLLLDVEHRFPAARLSSENQAALSLYQTVLEGQVRVAFNLDEPLHFQLYVAGLVTEHEGQLCPRSALYAAVFDAEWVQNRLHGRVIQRPLRQWQAHGRRESDLLSGLELARVEGWASTQVLSEPEQEYLRLSAAHQVESERRRLEQERDAAGRRARGRALLAGALAAAVVVAVAFAAYALREKHVVDQAIVRQEQLSRREQAGTALIAARDDALERETVRAALSAALPTRKTLVDDAVLNVAVFEAWKVARLLGRLHGHAGPVVYAEFSPDSERIVTASDDHTARVWDARDGRALLVLHHAGPVVHAAFSRQGQRIVTASGDRTAAVWDAATGRQLAVLRGHTSTLYYAEFSPDDARILTASDDGTARLWDASSGKLLQTLVGHSSTVAYAEFSPDGTRVVSAAYDGTARLWSVSTGAVLAVLDGHGGGVVQAQFSPDGERVVTASWDRTARVWNAHSGALLATLSGHADAVYRAVFSPDGTRIATASGDRTARLWDAATGRQLGVLSGHADAVYHVAFSRDGAQLVTASRDAARVWDAASQQLLVTLAGHSDAVYRAEFSRDGGRLVTASGDATLRVWSANMPESLAVLAAHSLEDLKLSIAPTHKAGHAPRAPADSASWSKLQLSAAVESANDPPAADEAVAAEPRADKRSVTLEDSAARSFRARSSSPDEPVRSSARAEEIEQICTAVHAARAYLGEEFQNLPELCERLKSPQRVWTKPAPRLQDWRAR